MKLASQATRCSMISNYRTIKDQLSHLGGKGLNMYVPKDITGCNIQKACALKIGPESNPDSKFVARFKSIMYIWLSVSIT